MHRLTLAARSAVEESGLAKRELIRRLGTSASQFYRLLDPGHQDKSVGQLLVLLHLVGHEVRVVARADDRDAAHRGSSTGSYDQKSSQLYRS